MSGVRLIVKMLAGGGFATRDTVSCTFAAPVAPAAPVGPVVPAAPVAAVAPAVPVAAVAPAVPVTPLGPVGPFFSSSFFFRVFAALSAMTAR